MKCWIVCEEYDGGDGPTGLVFTDKAKAEAYINAISSGSFPTYKTFLTEGELR